MNVFLHDFKTLEDFNDVATWIQGSDLDTKTNTIVFLGKLDQPKNSPTGMMLHSSSINLMVMLTEALSQIVAQSARDQQGAMALSAKISAALSEMMLSDFDEIRRRAQK